MQGIPPQARAGLAARLVAFVAAALTVACASAPPLGQDVISAVEIRGDAIAEDPELEVGLATHEDELFDQDVLEKDLERIRRFYRARGHYDAAIRAARVVRVGKHEVRVEIEVLGNQRVRHMIDGKTVLEYEKPQIGGGAVIHFDPAVKKDGTPLSEGYIALQAESHPTEFRKIEILNLSGCMDPKAKNFKSYHVHREDTACKY